MPFQRRSTRPQENTPLLEQCARAPKASNSDREDASCNCLEDPWERLKSSCFSKCSVFDGDCSVSYWLTALPRFTNLFNASCTHVFSASAFVGRVYMHPPHFYTMFSSYRVSYPYFLNVFRMYSRLTNYPILHAYRKPSRTTAILLPYYHSSLLFFSWNVASVLRLSPIVTIVCSVSIFATAPFISAVYNYVATNQGPSPAISYVTRNISPGVPVQIVSDVLYRTETSRATLLLPKTRHVVLLFGCATFHLYWLSCVLSL